MSDPDTQQPHVDRVNPGELENLEGPSGLSRRQLLGRVAVGGGAVAVPGLFISACGAGQSTTAGQATTATQATAKGKTRKITFMTHSVDPFFIPIVYGVREFTKFVGWDYQFTGPQTADNVPEIVNVLDSVVASKPDVIAMTITDPHAQDRAIEQALANGITVLCFNSQLTSVREKYDIPFIGMSDITSGYANGQLAAKYAQQVTKRKDGEIVVALIVPGASNLETRAANTIRGIKDYNTKNGTNFTWSTFGSDLDESKALSLIQAKYSKDQDKIVGWACTDWGDWYVGDFMDQNGLHGKFANGGFDTVPGVMKHMKKGNIQWALNQNPYAQGWVTAALAYMVVNYHYTAQDYQTGPEEDTAANLNVVGPREAFWTNVHVAEIKG